MLEPDTLLVGKYRILSVIGQGGYGQVYLSLDEGMGRQVAIKELLSSAAELSPAVWDEYQKRFRKEAQTAGQFNHPNVVTAFGLESDASGNLYLVLEYVDGGSLKDLLDKTEGPLEIGRALDIAYDLTQAVAASYRRDIVHRDIKPGNVLLTADGHAKLTDFGVAQVGHETRRTQEALGHPGTPAYKAPEQATSTGYLDERADLYAVGLVLYEMLTGRMYVRNRVAPHELNALVPAALDAVVLKAVEQAPGDRYQTADEMARDLDRVRGQDITGQAAIMLRAVPARRWLALAASVGVLMLLLGIYRLGGAIAAWPGATPTAAQASLPPTPYVPQIVLVTPQPTATESPVAPLVPTAVSDAFEPDDPVPAAISVGETQARSFAPDGDIDQAIFRVKAGLTYFVTTANLAPGVDTALEVDYGGQRYENDDLAPGTMASQVSFSATEDGTAVIIVRNADQYGDERRYDLSLMMSMPTETPTVLPTPTETPTPLGGELVTRTPLPAFTRTATLRISPYPSPTWTPYRSPTPIYTYTPTRTMTPTITRTPTVTLTPTITLTPTQTTVPKTATHTLTPEPTRTATPDRTPLPVRTKGVPTR